MDANVGISSSNMRYPRKRAVTACQLCRTRKTKCDNQRPSCRVCLSVGIPCHYADRNDHSSFDPASLEVIDRLNRIMSTQEDVLNALRGSSGFRASAALRHLPPAPYSPLQALSLPQHASQSGFPNRGPATDTEGVPSSNTSPDNVLMWPIFLGNYVPKCLQDAVFSLKSPDLYDNQGPNKGIKVPFQEDKVPELMERFFRLVHIKNPIVDQEELQKNARTVVEDGLSWDAGSCLVLLACALGRIAQPFRNEHQAATLAPTGYKHDSSDLMEAESYFSLARRRIGILTQSIAAVQCLFLCGVFYMYTFRPLDAFQSFHQASVAYQVYYKSQKGSSPISSDTDSKTEQALFWSCFKSECEILSEIDLPSSGVSHLDHIHIFPSPPSSDVFVTSACSALTPGSREHVYHDTLPHEQEQAWFYYLSEIALRRIGNRVLNSFYKESFESWKECDVPSTIQIANEFFRQLNEWHECLPAPMHFDDDSSSGILPDEELPYLLYTRLQEIRSWILRPFLFLAIHLPPRTIHRASLDIFVAESLTCHSRLIEGNSILHRHHGTWYMLRLSVTSALCLLAAERRNFEVPALQRSVGLAIETLRYWEAGAPGDIKEARLILEELLSAT